MALSTAIRHPSGFMPIALSGAALTVLLVHLAFFGAGPEMHTDGADEGPAAHLWQLFMTVQAPIVVFFAARWLRRDPEGALSVLALQVLAILAALAPVYLLHL